MHPFEGAGDWRESPQYATRDEEYLMIAQAPSFLPACLELYSEVHSQGTLVSTASLSISLTKIFQMSTICAK